MALRIGQVVLQECNRRSFLSRAIAARSKSWATHAFLYVGRGMAIEATFPQVRWFEIGPRLRKLAEEDRAVAILDYPGLKSYQRLDVVWQAMQYVGRIYDVGQLAIFAVTGHFWHDGPGTQACSRLITAAYAEGMGLNIFPDQLLAARYPATFPRLANLREGAVTPGDFLTSQLEVVDFRPSSTVRTLADFHR